MRQAATFSVSLGAAFDRVFDFLADARNLHLWTVEFALEAPVQRGDMFEVTTPRGTLELRVRADRASGVIDYLIGPAGKGNAAHSRLLRVDDGCVYVFTQFEPPGAPPGLFERLCGNVSKEMEILKGRFGS